ncbi:hypothetical protein [Mucilaginibacter sp.]|uniref:hypothetical protein n=1 Tax=Mucilaginibacter sp. TaxID=1882438 RepID=UPI0035BC502D
MKEKRTVLTLATGKRLYVDLAVNLIRSFWLWHSENGIRFRLVTDLAEFVPEEIRERIDLVVIDKEELGKGFSPKLQLDKLITEGQTLFIDSDCLIYRNLDFVFEQFRGHGVSVIGRVISEGEWFGNIRQICAYFGISKLPKFNGGVYYVEKGPESDRVYEAARRIEKIYDQAGFVRLRNRPNDEVILAVSMELNGQQAIADDGSVMAEFVNFRSGISSDLFRGKAELYNTPGHIDYVKEWPLLLAKPAIVHFLGHHNQLMPYIREAAQLAYRNPTGVLARIHMYFQVVLPYNLRNSMKKIFRPVYHALFGIRGITQSERVID